jgi:hypothetical protein
MARKEQIRDVFERVAKLADEVGLLDDSELALCEGGSRESGVPWTVYYTARTGCRVTVFSATTSRPSWSAWRALSAS